MSQSSPMRRPWKRTAAASSRSREPCQVRQGRDGAFAQRQRLVADQQRHVGALLRAQTLADGAPAERAIEREVVRIQRLETAAAVFARQVLAVAVDLPLRFIAVRIDVRDE